MAKFYMALALAISVAHGAGAQDKTSGKAAAEFEKLSKAFDQANEKFQIAIKAQFKKMEAAETEKEAQQIKAKIETMLMTDNPGPKYAADFLAFAQKNTKEPSALDALTMALRVGGEGAIKSGVRQKVIDHLTANYAASPDIRPAVAQATMFGDEAAEKLVREIIKSNPSRKIQAMACKQLAQGLLMVASEGQKIAGKDKLRAQYEKLLGKAFVDKMIANAERNAKEAKELTAQVKEKYADVFPDLSVGKMAPEVISQDLKGKETKLSDLKGKVVLLDVWATWCGPCRAMIPHEREMVEKFKKKPFVLVSVSADTKKETLTKFLEKTPMPWTHWWNGEQGGILEDWEIDSFPTLYVLDAKGVIRLRVIGSGEMERVESKINDLLKDLETTK